jgi:hypothetical protein
VAKLHELKFIKSKRVLLILGERDREREIDFVCVVGLVIPKADHER